jgi:hypothetical protein
LIQEQLEKAKEDKKGRKVIVDKDNNVIAVKNVNPEALPPLASSPALSIYDGAVDSHKNSKAITDKDKMKQQRKKTGIRVAGSRRVEDMYFKASNDLATSLAVPDSLSANAGVTVKVGELVRDGPPPPTDPRRISRKEYLEATSRVNGGSLYGGSSSSSYLDNSRGGGGGGGTTKSPSNRATNMTGTSSPTDVGSITAGGGGGGYADADFLLGSSSPNSLTSGTSVFGGGANRLNDIDIMEGGRRIEPQSMGKKASSDESEIGQGNATTTSSFQQSRLTGGGGGGGAGMSSEAARRPSMPARPQKPSLKTKAETRQPLGSPTEKWGPRDRNIPLSMIPNGERKKLPAPPVGQSTGHGVSVPGGGGIKNSSGFDDFVDYQSGGGGGGGGGGGRGGGRGVAGAGSSSTLKSLSSSKSKAGVTNINEGSIKALRSDIARQLIN